MNDVVCAIDIGTSKMKAALVDARGNLNALEESGVPAFMHNDGAVEFDATAYYATLCALLRRITATSTAGNITALILTTQRATLVPVGAGGDPVCAALSWQDVRGEELLQRFVTRVGRERFIQLTGLPPSALWTLAKILWLKEHEPACFQRASRFVLLHDYLLSQLGAIDFFTDPSQASCTGLFDIAELRWHAELLAAAGLTEARLSHIRLAGSPAGAVTPRVAAATGLRAGIPLLVGGGDQQCATLGVGAVDPGMASVSLGTAAVLSCPIDAPAIDPAGHIFCTAHVAPKRWVLEGIHNAYGSSLKWSSALCAIDSAQAFDELAAQAPMGASGVVYLPFLAGIGSPDFDANVRGAFLGLSLAHTRQDLARAVLEGIVLEMRRMLQAISHAVPLRQLVLSGGGTSRPLRNQLIADLTGMPIQVNSVREAGLLGAALLAWTGIGGFSTLTEAVSIAAKASDDCRTPMLSPVAREAIYRRYCRGVAVVQHAATEFNRPDDGEQP